MQDLLRTEKDGGDAVYCGGDYQALGVVRALCEHGLDVPRHASVVGGTGLDLSHTRWPGLTRTMQPLERLGEELLDMVCRRIERKGATVPGLFLPMSFVGGASTTSAENELLGVAGAVAPNNATQAGRTTAGLNRTTRRRQNMNSQYNVTTRAVRRAMCGPTLFALVYLVVPILATAGLTLVREGQAKAVIVTGASPPPAVVEGGQILRDHIFQSSGARLPIVAETELEYTVAENGCVTLTPGKIAADCFVLVGESKLASSLGVSGDGLGPGGIRIRTLGNALVLLGSDTKTATDPWGTLYAVTTFLEQFLGCRYLWPGESGKVVPPRRTITVPAIKIEFTPLLQQRRIRSLGYHDRIQVGLDRLRFSKEEYLHASAQAQATVSAGANWFSWQRLGGSLQLVSGHAFGHLWEKYGKEHPEWFAMQADGSRDQSRSPARPRLCKSNLDLIATIAREKIEELNSNPGVKSVAIGPNDGSRNSFCMCPDCKKLDPPEGRSIKLWDYTAGERYFDYVSLTDRMVFFWNAIAERVTKAHPNALLVADVYSVYAAPPIQRKLHPNIAMRFAPIQYLDEKARRQERADWDAWATMADKIYWRPNLLLANRRQGTPVVYVHKLAEDFKYLAHHGMIGTDFDSCCHNWATHGLNYYVAAKLHWDPDLDVDQLIDDYCKAGFGRAARQIKRYFFRIEQLTDQLAAQGPDATSSLPYRDCTVLFTSEAVKELRALLDRADKRAGSDEASRQRIAFLRCGLDFTELQAEAYRMWQAAKEQPESLDREAAARLLERRYRLMREIFRNHHFAVNVAYLCWGEWDCLSNPLGWSGPGAEPREQQGAEKNAMSMASGMPPAVDRPTAKGAGYFTDARAGDDANDGSEAHPWRSINHALGQLRSGDTLYLRGGTYFENVYCAVAGTADAPITIRAYPGEQAIIDGGIRAFAEAPADAWSPYPEGGAGEYRSTRPYKNIRDVVGLLGDSNIALQTYWYAQDLRAENEFWTYDKDQTVPYRGKPTPYGPKPVYCGPGLWYDRASGHIHVRLAHTHIENPRVANYRGETDPRRLPLVVAPFNSVPLTVDLAKHVRFQDLLFRGGGYKTINLRFGVNIAFEDCTIYCGTYGIWAKNTGPLKMTNCRVYGMIPPWAFVTENGLATSDPRCHNPFLEDAYPSYSDFPFADIDMREGIGFDYYLNSPHPLFLKARNIARLPTHALLVTEGGYEFEAFYYPFNHDWEVSYCEFTDGHDGVYVSGRNMRFHHNWVDRIQDDGIYLSSPTPYISHGVHIYQNLLTRVRTAFALHNRGGPNGDIFIYRNIVDLRHQIPRARPTPENPAGTVLPSNLFIKHGAELLGVESIYFYQNTFVAPATDHSYLHRTLYVTTETTKRLSFNNICLYLERWPLVQNTFAVHAGGLANSTHDIKFDGNLHWCPKAEQKAPPDFLEMARNCAASERNKKDYPPGWEANSLVADPKFRSFDPTETATNDYRLQQDSPAVAKGVPLPPEWNDPLRPKDGARPDIGALPVGVEQLRVGVRGRIRAGASEPGE